MRQSAASRTFSVVLLLCFTASLPPCRLTASVVMPGRTLKDCLSTFGVTKAELRRCASIREEWALIKKGYFKKVLVCHPDQGGDANVFLDVQASFEVLRDLFDEAAITSFAAELGHSTADLYEGSLEDIKGMPTPSWEYYAEAAEDVFATYRVELARSSRSHCRAKGSQKQCCQVPPVIRKGDLRIGFMLQAGTYGLWVHLQCWRVPSRIWRGLPDPATCSDRDKFEKALLNMNELTLCGARDLDEADRKKVVSYVMDKKHWAKAGMVKKLPAGGPEEKLPKTRQATGPEDDEDLRGDVEKEAGSRGAASEISLAKAKKQLPRFVIPKPGRAGAPKGSMVGKTFVLTGVFPEVGGGTGLRMGKEEVKKMIMSFGGRVTSAVSGKTDVLVVGKNPGFSKVFKARVNPKTRLLSLHDIKLSLERGSLVETGSRPMLVSSFSKGFGHNSKALQASAKELAIASGTSNKLSDRDRSIKQRPKLLESSQATKKRPTAARKSSAKK